MPSRSRLGYGSDMRPDVMLFLVAFAAGSGKAAAQVRNDARFGAPYHLPDWSFPAAPASTKPGVAFLSSALVPGAGQYLLREERWVPYLTLEAWALISYFGRRRDARALERRYKDLAWSVARRISSGERRDTTFEYYEALAEYSESGGFDLDPRPGTGVQPEADTATYNGRIWRLARSLYLPGGANFPVTSVEYQSALAYYMRNAIPPGYAWAWGGSLLEQQAYRDLIDGSDDAYRSATQLLGVIVANHLVSAVDALVTARLRSQTGSFRLRIGGGAQAGPLGPEWTYWVRLTW
jgi:hypothetical protein